MQQLLGAAVTTLELVEAVRGRAADARGGAGGAASASASTSAPRRAQQVVVTESAHPYGGSDVWQSEVRFGEEVQWMTLEFDARCHTSCTSDRLLVFDGDGYLRCRTSPTPRH